MGTEYNRADMLPTEDAAKVRELLRTYINQRILFYLNNENGMSEVNTAKLQTEPWSSVVRVATAQPTPVVPLRFLEWMMSLVYREHTQAAWLNRIPVAAWCLMGLIAICSNIYSATDSVGVHLRFGSCPS